MVKQSGELHLLPFPCCLTHTRQPLGHARLALCRVRDGLMSVLLDQRPSLLTLRRPTPRRRACGPYGYCLYPPACRESPLQAPPRSPGSRAWSFPTCMGPATTQGRPVARINATGSVAFRSGDSVGALIANFRSSIPSPSFPLFTLHWTPHSAQCKTRGRADRYSFLVRLFHPHSM